MILALLDHHKHACGLYCQYPDITGYPDWIIRKFENVLASGHALDSSDFEMHWSISVGRKLRILWIFSLRHFWNPRGYFLYHFGNSLWFLYNDICETILCFFQPSMEWWLSVQLSKWWLTSKGAKVSLKKCASSSGSTSSYWSSLVFRTVCLI